MSEHTRPKVAWPTHNPDGTRCPTYRQCAVLGLYRLSCKTRHEAGCAIHLAMYDTSKHAKPVDEIALLELMEQGMHAESAQEAACKAMLVGRYKWSPRHPLLQRKFSPIYKAKDCRVVKGKCRLPYWSETGGPRPLGYGNLRK